MSCAYLDEFHSITAKISQPGIDLDQSYYQLLHRRDTVANYIASDLSSGLTTFADYSSQIDLFGRRMPIHRFNLKLLKYRLLDNRYWKLRKKRDLEGHIAVRRRRDICAIDIAESL